MIYITGGCHRNYERFNTRNFPEQKEMTKDDYVIQLMRGQVFTIDGKKIFTFGGASSHDISSGILEPDAPDFKRKKKILDKGYRPYRANHISWWEQELPSEEEMEEGNINELQNRPTWKSIVDFGIFVRFTFTKRYR